MNNSQIRPTGSNGVAGDSTVPSATIRFFLSSTFADFQVERDVLQKRVFPELRQMCAAMGFRLQPIDLRWGVSEAAGADRQTMRICFDELERCRRLSPDFFLLIQLGDRYGSYILPPHVPADLVATLLPHLAPEERIAFDASFRLDANAVPLEYVLLRAEGPERVEDEQLRQALVRAGVSAGVSKEQLLPFTGSATHREIELGLLGKPAGAGHEAGVLCAVRGFSDEPRGPATEKFMERDVARAERVQQLTKAVLDRLPAEQVLRYTVDWRSNEMGPTFDEAALAEAYLGLLRPKLRDVIIARRAERMIAAALGRDEIALTNSAFEADRATRVEGRNTEQARLAAYLAGATGARQPLVVTGAAGSGKSTLLAEAATRGAATQPDAALVVRYVGITPGTESLAALLNDLRLAIARAYAQPTPALIADMNQLVGTVAEQLATLPTPPERPLLLIVDALDQLGDHTQRTDWLPPRLAPNVRVIVSVLADRPELGYLADRLPAEQVLTLGSLGREVGRAMLHYLLGVAPARTLAPAQEEAVLAAFAARGLPLHLRLLASQACRWRSFDPPRLDDAPLPEDTPELIEIILTQLEKPEHSGQALVARTLGDLAAARFGLAEDELLDLISRDADVRAEERKLSPESPPIDPRLPLPTALWARLHAELEPLLTERMGDQQVALYTFYHRQLREVVEARYLASDEGRERHRALANYFAAQPWRLAPNQWNWRKARELVTQYYEGAGDRVAAEQALTQLANELDRLPSIQADDPVEIIKLIKTLNVHLKTGVYSHVGQRLYKRELAARRQVGDRAGEAAALNNLGLLADSLGDKQQAVAYYEQALVIQREVGDRQGEGVALHNLGTLAGSQEAATYYRRALAIQREVGDRQGEGATLNSMGALARSLNQPEEAAQYYKQALAIFRELGDQGSEGSTLHNLGTLAHDVGQLEETAQYYEQALAVRRAVGDHQGEGSTLNSIGALADERGQPTEAAQYYEQALAAWREAGDRQGEGTTLLNLGALARDLGILALKRDRLHDAALFYEQAAKYYRQTLAIQREADDRQGEGATLYDLGTLALEQGQPEEAAKYYKQALTVRRAAGDRKGEAVTLNSQGSLADDLGKLAHDRGNVTLELQCKEEAAQYYEQALAIFRAERDLVGEAVTLRALGTLALERGRPEEATRYYEQALAIFEHIGAVDEARMVQGNLQNLLRLPAPQPEHADTNTVPDPQSCPICQRNDQC